jgi:exopolysaccharide biosynthesis polyprenyl glycosylphosphotransferase
MAWPMHSSRSKRIVREQVVGVREQVVKEQNWPGTSLLQPGPALRLVETNISDTAARVHPRTPTRSAWHRGLKRAIDFLLATALLVLLAPTLVVMAILIRLDSPGPFLFRQRRLGQNGKPFKILKFRSLHVLEDGDDLTQVTKNDTRITRVGYWLRKTSLDELPQLVNVVRGEMALVGPRPHAIVHDRLFAQQIENYELRQLVKPGITGWAQIHGLRGETATVEEMRKRVVFDLWYVANASTLLDLRILLGTPREVLRQRNAH